jgi:hypothetical protein
MNIRTSSWMAMRSGDENLNAQQSNLNGATGPMA